MTIEHVSVNRNQLYELLWFRGPLEALKTYGISKSALCTACRALQVPVPKAAYLKRLRAGKPVVRDELLCSRGPTELKFAHIQKVPRTRGKLSHDQQVGARVARPPRWTSDAAQRMHPLRRALKEGLQQGAADSRGWLVCNQPGLFKIVLSKTSRRDGLSIVEALFDVLQAGGYAPRSDVNGLSPAYVDVLGVFLTFELSERSIRQHEAQERRDMRGLASAFAPQTNYEHTPTGCFELAVTRRGANRPVLLVRARNAAGIKEELPWFVLRLPELARTVCPTTTPPLIRGKR